jgi:predicted amidophosphoribosyltransferase
MGTWIKLIMLALILYFFYTLYRTIKSIFGSATAHGDRTIPFARAEECPCCGARIRVAKQPGSCPKCAAPLGRGPDGKLLIRIN